jgi:hypothetical protein
VSPTLHLAIQMKLICGSRVNQAYAGMAYGGGDCVVS